MGKSEVGKRLTINCEGKYGYRRTTRWVLIRSVEGYEQYESKCSTTRQVINYLRGDWNVESSFPTLFFRISTHWDGGTVCDRVSGERYISSLFVRVLM